ncbi:MAG: putative transport system permease protein [Solirubrobacterales bacterium]|nr:putative transport system permease protein [Solirubrobacterales bacterium]
MTSLGLKSLWARKVRALLTIFAVFLGVAFVSGSYVITDTIFAAFDEIFSESLKGTSVVVSAENPVEQESGEIPTISAALLPRVEKTPGVRRAAGAIFTPGAFFDSENEKIGNKFAPKFISSTLPDGLESLTYVDGHMPRGPTEASLDKAAAADAGLELSETIKLIGQGRLESFRLVGFTQLGNASFGGASIAQVTLPVAQKLTNKRGRFDQISVAADDGVSAEALKRRIAREMPAGVRVETGQENADRGSEEIREDLGFLQTFLLVFGFIAVFVGSFLIFNTFSITVAQRVSEFGMLRTLGASRRQILTTVIVEAVAIGLLGALLGIAGGFLIATAINALFEAFGIDLPTTNLVMESRTVVVALLVGVVVTTVSSLVPALRSTRVPPIAALHSFRPAPTRRRRLVNLALSLVLGGVGLAMVLFGLFGSGGAGTRAGLIGGGAVAIVFAVSIFSPRLVPPLAAVAGWPLERVRRLTGRLARENAQRNPSRTAVTAAALMIGLALVAFVTVFAAGLKSTVAQVVDENFAGGLVIQNTDGFSPIPNGTAKAAAAVPGVELVSTIRSAEAKLLEGEQLGPTTKVNAPSPDIGETVNIDWEEGGPRVLRDLTDREAIVSSDFADSHDLALGDRFGLLTQTGARPRFRVVGQFDSKLGVLGSVLVTQRAMARDFRQTQDLNDFVKVEEGASADRVQALLSKGVEVAFPVAEVLNQQELKESREEQINQLVMLVIALLVFAILISLFGIANTLALSIHERTRELGMLRAIGMSRRQVRTMIRYEAVITALIGAILGMVLGLIFAALIAQPLKDEGFTLSYPVGTLILLLVFAAIVGVLAAILPARRASRLNVLESLQYE